MRVAGASPFSRGGSLSKVPHAHLSDFRAKPSKGPSKYVLPASILPFVYQESRRSTLAHGAPVRRDVGRASRVGPPRERAMAFDELVQWTVEVASLGR